MKYISTRGKGETYDDVTVLLQGLAPDGGLFVPETIPELDRSVFEGLVGRPYAERAAHILKYFLPSFTLQELMNVCRKVYTPPTFVPEPAPLVRLNPFDPSLQMLELWHGPTAAFKDLALQLLPELQTLALQKQGKDEKLLILTATSGDTGKAALEAYKDQASFGITVLYPDKGVAPLQELQMVTTEGNNVEVIAIEGDFDAAQKTVKNLFQDEAFLDNLKQAGYRLSSANSINWGRLLAQIVYYVSAYVSLLGGEGNQQAAQWYGRDDGRQNHQKYEDEIKERKDQALDYHAIPFDVCVPSGNFGNILAAWYSKQLGVPIRELICASNRNRVLADFFRSGVYEPEDKLFKTNSPSMDILVASNFERLLFEKTNHDAQKVKQWMDQLQEKGRYKVDKRTYRRIREDFRGGFASNKAVDKMIREIYHRFDHIIDPHTAVAFDVLKKVRRNKKNYPTIVVSTASPHKFPDTVVRAIFGPKRVKGESPQALQALLERESDMPIPAGLRDLDKMPVLHDTKLKPQDVRQHILERFGAGLDQADQVD